jgi:ATP-binding cassette subfamily F protein 3
MIRIENLTKTFGSQVLLDDVSFAINPREKIGLVGRNGHGKTTLMRLITGEEHPDSGSIEIPKNYTVGYITQHLAFASTTVREEAAKGLPVHESDELWRAEKILSGLGFGRDDFDRSPAEFSGGFQVRLNLAKVLVSNPDLLLLDEPTNYLDITSIRWLESFLRGWSSELLLITHDRSFMDSVVTHSVAIHRKKIRKIDGDTTKLYERIAKDEEIYEKTRLNDEKKRRDTELFISRFRAKARLAGLVQSRIKNLERMGKRDWLEKIDALEFSFNESDFAAKSMARIENVSFGYDKAEPLIQNFDLTVGKGDRIGVIGRNGKGKTTLLRILAGDIKPWGGELSYHSDAKIGYFAQTNVASLESNRTVEEEIAVSDPSAERQKARSIAGSMMFEGDAALKKIEVLSGGEKSRVMLGKIIMKPANILFLDEPTNHLDMQSCDALLQAIDNFEGAIIIVTHNEMFLHAIANRLVIFQDGRTTVFEGSYEDFLEKVGWEEERGDGRQETRRDLPVLNKKEIRKIRSDIITRRNKVIKPLEDRSAMLEKQIHEKESRLSSCNEEMITAASQKDGARIQLLSKDIHDLKESIDELYHELELTMAELEAKGKEFDDELSALGDTQ